MAAFNNSSKQVQARELKHRVLTCLHKLSDRDTHTAAASELESIAITLTPDALPPFISSVSATDASDKSPVRRHCLRLISVLSDHHKNALSPHLSKLLSAIVRRLRDPNSAVRSACVAATLSLSTHLTSPPFTSIAKPFIEALFTEQDSNAQNAAALCLAAVINGSRNPDVLTLRKLVPRLEKLTKCESFKPKAAILGLMGSVVGVKGVLLTNGGKNTVNNLIVCLMGFLSSDDWAARKASAEALLKIAIIEKDSLSECKASCLKTFEAKRFDKVKAARETMNHMIEAWKEIPDLSDEASPLHESQAISSKENASDGRYPPGLKTPCSIGSTQVKKRSPLSSPATRTPFSDASSARKRSPRGGNENKTGPPMFRKLDRNPKVEILAPTGDKEEKQFVKPDIKRALFSEKQKPVSFKGGSRVVPCGDASVVVSNETGDIYRKQRECDDLSLIRKQLVQIESQQSNLMDLLQRFIGSSQNGMNTLEARVHGLELALDEISFDLSVSTKRMLRNDAVCCKLPGTEFLSSMLRGKAEAHSSASRLPSSGGVLQSSGVFRKNSSGLMVKNPLAKMSHRSLGLDEVSSSVVNRGDF